MHRSRCPPIVRIAVLVTHGETSRPSTCPSYCPVQCREAETPGSHPGTASNTEAPASSPQAFRLAPLADRNAAVVCTRHAPDSSEVLTTIPVSRASLLGVDPRLTPGASHNCSRRQVRKVRACTGNATGLRFCASWSAANLAPKPDGFRSPPLFRPRAKRSLASR